MTGWIEATLGAAFLAGLAGGAHCFCNAEPSLLPRGASDALSIDVVVELLGRGEVLRRLSRWQ